MIDQHHAPLHHAAPRVTVATVALGRGSTKEDIPKIIIDELLEARFAFVRNVTVNREKHFIRQLISNVATSNEADALILVGGVGLGPRDFTCEAVDEMADRRIEGFGEAFRRLLREELHFGVGALLARATAGVCNKVVVIALPRQAVPLRRAVQALVIPTLADAARFASGQPQMHPTP